MARLEDTHIAISADESFPDDVIDEFAKSLRDTSLTLISERRPTTVFAAAEWLLPTLVVLFVSRKLFDAFLSEAGKDLYGLVKGAMIRIVGRTTGHDAEVHATYVLSQATPKKVSGKSPPILSVYALLADGRRVKFVFTPDLTAETHEQAVGAMLATLMEYYRSGKQALPTGPIPGGLVGKLTTLPVVFDRVTGEWRAISESELRGDV